jgi:hypothetical protein
VVKGLRLTVLTTAAVLLLLCGVAAAAARPARPACFHGRRTHRIAARQRSCAASRGRQRHTIARTADDTAVPMDTTQVSSTDAESDDSTANVVEDGADQPNPNGPPPTQAGVQTGSPGPTQCRGQLDNYNRIYNSSGVHIGTITKTVGGWCVGNYTVLSVSHWGHLVPWINPQDPQLCWATYTVGHGPDGTWLWDQGAWHTNWAHGYIQDAIGAASSYGCVVPPGATNYWSIIRMSQTPFHWDGYNDFGLQPTV